jgi:hypothetical protein
MDPWMTSFVIKLAQGLIALTRMAMAEPVILGFFGLSLLIVGSGVRRRASLATFTHMIPGQTAVSTPIVAHSAGSGQSSVRSCRPPQSASRSELPFPPEPDRETHRPYQ